MVFTVQENRAVQQQTHSMSQNTILSCNILAMGVQELSSYVQELVLENPLLSLDAEPHASGDASEERAVIRLSELAERAAPEGDDYCDIFGKLHNADADLRSHLRLQIPKGLSSEDNKLMRYIIECIDENGYFLDYADVLASPLGVSPEKLFALLSLVQAMDPPGVGARTLDECLTLQLRARCPDETLALEIVREHLELLAKNQLKTISQRVKRPMDEVCRARNIIRCLEPRPGSAYFSTQSSFITPDVLISHTDFDFAISLGDRSRPMITVDTDYYTSLKDSEDESVKSYVSEKYQQANLIRSFIEKRNRTLLAVSRTIFEAQKPFFHKGPQFLRPLNLKTVAEALECHESTVSRAIKDKYLRCSWGVFELRYFFSNTLDCPDGFDACNARSLIEGLISGEPKAHPYSDQKIAQELTAGGLAISRRTVTKYREAAGIGNSSCRKSFEHH